MTKGISIHEKKVLQYIIQYRSKHQYSPSLREIAAGVGNDEVESKVSSMRYIIEKLVSNGYLTSVGFIARSYIPTGKELT